MFNRDSEKMKGSDSSGTESKYPDSDKTPEALNIAKREGIEDSSKYFF